MQLRKAFNKLRSSLRLHRFSRIPGVELSWPIQIDPHRIALVENCKLKLGIHCIINGSLRCQKAGSKIEINERVFIGVNTQIVSTSLVAVGSDVLIAHNCYISDTDGHSLSRSIRKRDVVNRWKGIKDWSVVASEPIIINDDAWIGPNVTILKEVTVGEGAIVCAGSVVTQSVAPMTMVGGVPAQLIRNLES